MEALQYPPPPPRLKLASGSARQTDKSLSGPGQPNGQKAMGGLDIWLQRLLLFFYRAFGVLSDLRHFPLATLA